MKTDKTVIDQTKLWIKQFILKYSICPFAKRSVETDLISYRVCPDNNNEKGLIMLVDYFRYILSTSKDKISNAFMIFPGFMDDFQLFLDFFDYSCILLDDMHLEDQLQMVAFHPLFQFEGESYDDPSNFTNRSPFPMIHILRVDEVSEAIDSHPDIEKVPEVNKSLLRGMSKQNLESIKMLLR